MTPNRQARRAAVAELLHENRYRVARLNPSRGDIEPAFVNLAADIVERIEQVDRWAASGSNPMPRIRLFRWLPR